MAVIPSPEVLAGWTNLRDAARWAGVDEGTKRAFCRQLGDPDLDSLMILAVVPAETVDSAINLATKGARKLNVVEKSMLVIMMAAVKAKFNGFTGQVGTMQAPPGFTAGAGPPDASNSASSATKVKIKLSQVIDQGSDQETEMLSMDDLQKLRRNYVLSQGDNPLEQEEITDSQLTCLFAKVQAQQAPFTDMGVFGPYGDRMARAMKFVSQQWKDGQWRAVELPGATDLDQWEQSWKIFRTGCIMLGIATAAVLDRYSSEFKQRVTDHPGVWHLAAQADIRCRSEYWQQELRRQQAFHQTHPQMSSFVPEMPWNSVIKASSSNREFWSREFEKPAMLYSMQGARPTPARPTPPPMVPPSEAAISPASTTPRTTAANTEKKRGFDPQRKDGRYFRSKTGVNICYAWSREKDGCSNTKCERGMAHVCEFCRQPHRSIDCTMVPGWDPNAKPSKGQGRGRGRGNAPKRRHM